MSQFRVRLWDTTGSGRGRGAIKAIIDDAKDIGGSQYGNDGGEFFMTLPYNHPSILQAAPLTTHYEVSRLNGSSKYIPIFAGLLDGLDVTKDEVVVHGRDYLSLLDTTISASGTSYTSSFIGDIVTAQISAAVNESNSRVNFIAIGTIDTTTTTTTVLTSFQPRLKFISGLADILMSNRSVRSIIAVEPRSSSAPSFNFTENKGADKETVRLEYGGNVNDFHVKPPYENLSTRVNAIGQKRDGALVLYSTQTYASESTYGLIAEPALFIDVTDQAALDSMALRRARHDGNPSSVQALVRVKPNALAPWDGYDLGDSIRLVIDRDPRNATNGWDFVNALYTVWGLEWIGHGNGNEELFFDLRIKET